LPINNIDKTLIEFIKNIENNISGRPDNIIRFTKNNSTSILSKFSKELPSVSPSDRQLSFWLKVTCNFIKDHSELLVTKAE